MNDRKKLFMLISCQCQYYMTDDLHTNSLAHHGTDHLMDGVESTDYRGAAPEGSNKCQIRVKSEFE